VLGKRRFFRIKGSYHSIKWAVEGSPISGEGKVCNISVDGLAIEIEKDKSFQPSVGCVLLIEPVKGQTYFLQSAKAKVAWSQKIVKDGVESIKCGLVFIK